jgi:hypothetical protein
MKIVLAIGIILFAVGAANGDTGFYISESGIELKHLCDGDGDGGLDRSIYICGGYVNGVMDALTVYQVSNKLPPCFPRMTAEQVILITKRWFGQHPEELHMPAAYCISRAIYEAYPACRN